MIQSLNLTTPDRRPYSVIFADDDPDTLEMLFIVGRHQGWEVETATTAEELLAKVEERCLSARQCFDIVVTDVSFFNAGQPGVSGITAGRQLERAFPNLPILFLTGYGGLLTRDNIKQISTADYLEKPAEPRNLIARIEYLIRFTSNRYEGPERRRTSINRSNACRRSSDQNIGVPKVLKLVMAQQ